MNTLNGYSKGNDANTSVLLAAGGSKPLSGFRLTENTVPSDMVGWEMHNNSVSGGITLTDAILDDFRGNKIAFLDPSCITVQYSTNGGTSWSDYELTDAQKVALTTTPGGTAIYLGKVATAGTITPSNVANYKSRIYINTRNASGTAKMYTYLKRVLINISTNGASGCTVKIDRQTIGDYNNRGSGTRYNTNESAWTNIGTYEIQGRSGWNSIYISSIFGGGTSQTSNDAALRFTFSATSANTSYPSNCTVIGMRFIGITNWQPASTMASTGHLYTYDTSQNTTFPANVTATSFIGSLSGNATSATNATNDSDGHAINSTYLKRSGGTMTGSITFPDDVADIIFRAGNASYTTKLSYQTSGNEALVLSSYATVNSFIIANGVTSSTSSSQWQSIISPGLQIKNNCVNIGALWGHGITPNYKLNVNGNTNISGDLIVTGDASVKSLTVTGSNNLLVQGNVTAASFIKSGGTASQVLMADGSVKTMSQIVSGGESTKYWANVAISSSSNDQTAPTFKSQTIKITDTNVASTLFSDTTTYQIGTTKRELHLNYSSGSGTGVNDGRLSAITFGNSAAYAGIYVQSSGSYGSRMVFGTTSSFANGSYGRVIIDNSGNVGIGTMSPSYKLHVNGTSYFTGATMITNDLTLYATSGSSPFLNFRRGTYTDDLDDWRVFANGSGFFIQRTSGSTTNWVNRLMLAPNVSSGTNAAYLYSNDGTSDRIVTQSMIVTSSANGVTPKVINTNTATVTSEYYVLASSTGSNTPSWYKLPSTAFSSGQTYSLVTGSANGLVHAPTSSQSSSTDITSSYYVYATNAIGTAPKWYKTGNQIHVVTTLPSSPVTGDVYFITSNA